MLFVFGFTINVKHRKKEINFVLNLYKSVNKYVKQFLKIKKKRNLLVQIIFLIVLNDNKNLFESIIDHVFLIQRFGHDEQRK